MNKLTEMSPLDLEYFKLELVDSGFCAEVNKADRILAFSETSDSEAYSSAKQFQEHWHETEYKESIWHLAEEINHLKNERTWYMTARIKRIVYNASEPVFLTFTFTDECLSNTTEETRKKYVRRFLKANGCEYVANIDFGAQNGREHYHAVASKRVPVTEWTHGTINAEQIRVSSADQMETSCKKLGKYVSKLTNHAKKDTAGYKAIYSRKPPHKDFIRWISFDDVD